MREPLERIAGLFQLINLRVQCRYALLCELTDAGSIVARVKQQQLLDLFQREAGRLRLPDELQAPHVVRTIAPDPVIARWRLEQPSPLVEPDRFDAHAAGRRELSDGE